MPVVTIEDLGILRDLEVDEAAATSSVTITRPTPAARRWRRSRADIEHEAAAARLRRATVQLRAGPAWTTDWMTERGRQRLREFGIAPPAAGPPAATAARWP